jgi:hypothetical protein
MINSFLRERGKLLWLNNLAVCLYQVPEAVHTIRMVLLWMIRLVSQHGVILLAVECQTCRICLRQKTALAEHIVHCYENEKI